MKVFFVTLLAIVIVPLIFAYFQNAKYEDQLKPSLLSEARELVSSSGVENLEVKMDKLDVVISGVTDSKDGVEELKQSIEALGGGAVRAAAISSSIQVYGDVDVQKLGSEVMLSGKMSNPSTFTDSLNAADRGTLGDVKVSDKLDSDEVYGNSTVLKNTQFPKWSAQYLAIKGDRGYKVSASDNVIRPYGEVTPGLKKRVADSAEEMGLTLESSSLTVVNAEQVDLDITHVGGKKSISGKGPTSIDLAAALNADENKLETDDFVDVHPSVASPKFHKWVGSFFSTKGERAIHVKHDQVTLTGSATQSEERQWIGDLLGQGLKPLSKLETSEPVRPKPVANPSAGGNDALLQAFALNQVFFDSSSSAVRADQQSKIDALASAISAAGKEVSFVIGGHADASGNAEFNKQLSKKRAASVVAALAQKGISSERFSIVSFGATKASSSASKERARKVEVRIK